MVTTGLQRWKVAIMIAPTSSVFTMAIMIGVVATATTAAPFVLLRNNVINLRFLSACANFSDYVAEDTLHLGIKNKSIYFVLLSVCSIFSACCASPEIRLRFGKLQINLRFLSACTNFARYFVLEGKIINILQYEYFV